MVCHGAHVPKSGPATTPERSSVQSWPGPPEARHGIVALPRQHAPRTSSANATPATTSPATTPEPRSASRYRAASPATPPDEQDPDEILWLLDQWSHSWAAIHHQPDQPGPYRVRQYGPRRFFDEVSAAYRSWKAAGKPPAHTWRITITPEGQRAELINGLECQGNGGVGRASNRGG